MELIEENDSFVFKTENLNDLFLNFNDLDIYKQIKGLFIEFIYNGILIYYLIILSYIPFQFISRFLFQKAITLRLYLVITGWKQITSV
jgi:hypothetical protein